MDKYIVELFENLEKNNIKGIYAESKEQAAKMVEEMLFEGAVITSGGSVSVKESGIWDIIKDKKYRFFDRSDPTLTEEQRQECFRESIGADFYFCSSNAVTQNGELVNVDGFSNRISSIAFGPKRVIMVVGKNKLVKDVNEAFIRIKKIAAPKNCVRLGIDSPCAKLGHCVSLLKTETPAMTDGCDNQRRICRNYLVSSKQNTKDRIIVLFVNENLGY